MEKLPEISRIMFVGFDESGSQAKNYKIEKDETDKDDVLLVEEDTLLKDNDK